MDDEDPNIEKGGSITRKGGQMQEQKSAVPPGGGDSVDSGGGSYNNTSSSKEKVPGVGESTSPSKAGGSGGDSSSRPSSSGGSGVVTQTAGMSSPLPAKKTPNDFIFGKLLGEGSFSSVYLAKDVKTGKEFAIKVCDKQHILREKKAESIRREKEVLTILSGNRSSTAPFFVHLYATFQDTQRLYFVVTFAHGGELLKYLHKVGAFEPTSCRFYSAEILQALKHLHSIGIVHRDLKPENILLSENGHILITDFGSAKIIKPNPESNNTPTASASSTTSTGDKSSSANSNRNRSNSFVGTAQYVSPEVLKGRYTEVGPAADLWAFGCVLYQLIAGVLPFQATNEFLIFQKILKLEYGFPDEFPAVAKDLVDKLLKIEPGDRLGANDEQLYKSIQGHPFFDGVNFDGLSQQVPPPIKGMTSAVSASVIAKSQNHSIPETYEPGFDPRVIAERVLKSEQDDLPDSDSDADGGSCDLVVSSVSDGMGRLNVAGDNNNHPAPVHTISTSSSRSIQLPQDDAERKQRLEEQLKQNPTCHAAVKGNLILKQGLVNKKKGLFARRRLLFLTEGPHLYYCEPGTMTVKGEIPWSKQLRPEAKDFKIFFVHTPNRIYNLEDPEGYALEWCRAINEIHQHVYGNTSPTSNP